MHPEAATPAAVARVEYQRRRATGPVVFEAATAHRSARYVGWASDCSAVRLLFWVQGFRKAFTFVERPPKVLSGRVILDKFRKVLLELDC